MKMALEGMQLLDASFRHAVDPLNTPQQPHPPTEVPMEMSLLKGEKPNAYAVTLRVKIDSPLYSLSVAYAVFLMVDPEGAEPPPDMDNRVLATGASMVFPYCRELIGNLTARGKFGPVWINPTNFSAILASQRSAEAAAAAQ